MTAGAQDAFSAAGLTNHRLGLETHVEAERVPLVPLLGEASDYALHYGNARVPMVRVAPDHWKMLDRELETMNLRNEN
jgi:hypothetical protein